MNQPLVTILVVCHNQSKFIGEALESCFLQTYNELEIIIVDDASTDGSREIIDDFESNGHCIKKMLLSEPRGYCKAFNLGLSQAKGEYIIDLAGDDILLPTRVAEGIASLENGLWGVNFCDAYYINEASRITGTHYRRDTTGQLLENVPQGNVFAQVLERYFICTPTMMISREVLDHLGGYDEALYYEDFDFWVRSSRLYTYSFINRVLVKKRVLKNSMSKSQYLPGSKMLPSTLKVCQKAFDLCQSKEEYQSLFVRVRYELRQAVLSNNYSIANELHNLLGKFGTESLEYRAWAWLLSYRWNFSFVTSLMGRAR